ncbi:GcrA family cell cycle regulator [Novosphingobium sp. G106]|nr:GcrA family cell cycle regulator [Novosphingobium sp. G106]
MLAAKLEDLVERGRKLLPGSPKTQRNQDERVELERRIARLDRGIAKGGLFAAEGRNWTAIETDILRKLWLEGCSASEIAQRIGHVSRNAVISKAKRLELPIRAQSDLPPRQTSEDELTG